MLVLNAGNVVYTFMPLPMILANLDRPNGYHTLNIFMVIGTGMNQTTLGIGQDEIRCKDLLTEHG